MRKKVTNFCKSFREEILEISLTDFCKKTNTNYKTMWAFENNISENLKNVIYYYELSNVEQKEIFKRGLWECL